MKQELRSYTPQDLGRLKAFENELTAFDYIRGVCKRAGEGAKDMVVGITATDGSESRHWANELYQASVNIFLDAFNSLQKDEGLEVEAQDVLDKAKAEWQQEEVREHLVYERTLKIT